MHKVNDSTYEYIQELVYNEYRCMVIGPQFILLEIGAGCEFIFQFPYFSELHAPPTTRYPLSPFWYVFGVLTIASE